MNEYYNDLACQLRKNGCTEAQVTDVLGTVVETTTATGHEPHEDFGDPTTYAAQYTGPRKRSPGSTVLNAFGASGLAVFVFFAVFPDLFPIHFDSRFMQTFGTFLLFAAWVLIGGIIGGVVDNRPPQAFTETFQKHRAPTN